MCCSVHTHAPEQYVTVFCKFYQQSRKATPWLNHLEEYFVNIMLCLTEHSTNKFLTNKHTCFQTETKKDEKPVRFDGAKRMMEV